MPTNSSESVLVAGGAGYIGSHTAKYLRQQGLVPVVVDNLITGNRFALRYGPHYEGSIADAALIARIVAEHRPLGAILFAAHAYVGESTAEPRKYYQNNVSAAITFLDALIDAGVRSVVFSSSCSVYGQPSKVPIPEDSPPNPLSPYAESKMIVEKVLRWYDSAYSLRSASLRYFNAAGADPDGEIGECHDPEPHLIPRAISAAMGGPPLEVFGTDYPTPDGTAIRDYIHVADLAAAHVLALRRLADGGESMALNLGTGTGHSVLEVVRAVERISGKTVPIKYGPRRLGDAPSLVADARRAHELLGWRPQWSGIDTIVESAWRWHSRGNA